MTDAERKFIMQKLKDDGQFSVSGEAFSIKYVWESMMDWKTWVSSKSSVVSLRRLLMIAWGMAVLLAAG